MAKTATVDEVRFQLPRELADQLGEHGDELSEHARAAFLVMLVVQGKLSKSRAANVLGMHLTEFAALLDRYKVPYFDEDDVGDEALEG